MTNTADSPAIQVTNIHKSFGVVQALRGISFSLHAGDFLTIFGPNGAGKTTLIKILAGLTRATGGTAKVAGFDVSDSNPHLRREIGVIAQEVEAQFPELVTVWGEESYRAVDYGRLAGVLIEAIKELRTENKALKKRLEALEEAAE